MLKNALTKDKDTKDVHSKDKDLKDACSEESKTKIPKIEMPLLMKNFGPTTD
jgi:hypothetical protein